MFSINAKALNNKMIEYKNCAVYNIAEDFIDSVDDFQHDIIA